MAKDDEPFIPPGHGTPWCPNWTPLYDDEGNIVGRVCTACGVQEGG